MTGELTVCAGGDRRTICQRDPVKSVPRLTRGFASLIPGALARFSDTEKTVHGRSVALDQLWLP
jgi:hypothetical protein